ncbi:MAG: hypothetical protein AAGA68_27500, partial [Pseudomonadota bacterium]
QRPRARWRACEPKALNAASGVACARISFDDTFVVGPPTPQLFDAIGGRAIALKRNGLLVRDKCAAYSPAHGAGLADLPDLQQVAGHVVGGGQQLRMVAAIPIADEGRLMVLWPPQHSVAAAPPRQWTR